MLKSVPTLGMGRWLRASIKRVFTKTAWFGAVGAPQNTRVRGVCAAHSPHRLGDKKGHKRSETRYDIFRNDILV
jgi:hypothetical protein